MVYWKSSAFKFWIWNLNGFYSPQRAKYVCERDLQCGGFTFKGARNISIPKVEIYFFHYISDQASYLNTEIECPHWTTYIVGTRYYIVINGTYVAEYGEAGNEYSVRNE